MLIADRGNNRLLLVDAHKHILWQYPPRPPAPPGVSTFPTTPSSPSTGKAIISNEEDNDTIVMIAYPSGRLLWSYGHPQGPRLSPGYLNQPDDAYLLKTARSQSPTRRTAASS